MMVRPPWVKGCLYISRLRFLCAIFVQKFARMSLFRARAAAFKTHYNL